jgi:hypothetical protein
MKYLLLICADESIDRSPGKEEEIAPAAQAWVAEMEGRGVRLQGHQLRPVSDASTVRVRNHPAVAANEPVRRRCPGTPRLGRKPGRGR